MELGLLIIAVIAFIFWGVSYTEKSPFKPGKGFKRGR